MTAAPGPRRPLGSYFVWMFVGALALAAIAALDWDLTALTSDEERRVAWQRLLSFLSAFGAPDLSRPSLENALSLAGQTLSIALLGTLLGAVLAYPLALGAARCVVIGEARPASTSVSALRRGLLELCRLSLDVLRGVPDFAWALLILTVLGPGPITCVVAIGINVAGILGKIYSELWDSVPASRYAALQSTGAGRLTTLLYGVQPLAARSMLSYTLMRCECAIRNASVIGVVGGGGLGAAIFDELNFGNYNTVVTLLLFTLALTGSADILANLLRYQLRTDPNHPRAPVDTSLESSRRRRRAGMVSVAIVLLSCAFLLREGLRDTMEQLGRQEWDFIRRWLGQILRPDFSAATILEAAQQSVVPLSMGLLATMVAVVMAGALAYPASYALQIDSHRFTGENTAPATKLLRALFLAGARVLALLFRGIPEVAWVLILAAFFRMGMVPGLLGLTLHSAGVLARVFTETVDNIPHRRFEQADHGSRATTFLYAALPTARLDWKTYSFFQFEVNVRAGIVLGIIGVGGLGDAFHTSIVNFTNPDALPRASTFLLTMVLLTVAIDRTSRWLKIRGVRC